MDKESLELQKAKALLEKVQGAPLPMAERCQQAVALAGMLMREALSLQTEKEKRSYEQLAAMLQDPSGREFTTRVLDQCFRSKNAHKIANQACFLIDLYGIPRYLSRWKRLQLRLFHQFAKKSPALFVSFLKRAVHKETATVVFSTAPALLRKHLLQRRKEGVRTNLNHLGEAILGEEEAQNRLEQYLSDLANPFIECISIKISTIFSQINPLAKDATLAVLKARLRQLYRAAGQNLYERPDGTHVPKLVNLDMEEYRDLDLTVAAFQDLLDESEFLSFSAGIVLQSYLPDSYKIQRRLTLWARERCSRGGAPIRLRLVKGANGAMERVDAALHDWPQAPYEHKWETDANFKRMLLFGTASSNAEAVHLGIGSHNLFDIAFAMILREENQIGNLLQFEMLEGMASHIRRAVQKISPNMLLYCPIASVDEFQNAVAYLMRRLDENTAKENFLSGLFDLSPGSLEWEKQASIFVESCLRVADEALRSTRRRTQNRFVIPPSNPSNKPFSNEPDSDWSLPINQEWVLQLLQEWSTKKFFHIPLLIAGKELFSQSRARHEDPSHPGHPRYEYSRADSVHLEEGLSSAVAAQSLWEKRSFRERSRLLAEAAQQMRSHRGELIGAMAADTGKIVAEADLEVSEAIDFAEYYRKNLEELHTLEDLEWSPKGVVLVAPPWNFPCSIPAGCITAALVTGNCVLFKPAPEAVWIGWELAQLFWRAGVPKDVLQFIPCADTPEGTQLVCDPRISSIALTGATSTAKHFIELRPDVNLIAETGGKNSIIVTASADRDLAIKDIIHSAFSHAGQKCSACSLLICEAEVYDDLRFRRQLCDAASSLKVGTPWDPGTRLNPLICPPSPTLLRALTTLDAGEEWLLQPRQDLENPHLWTPGIKLGVKEGSFMHQTELFGPVLSMMRAETLTHALQLANGTPYGLTAGIHTLDQREQQLWLKEMEAGNSYINRGITGAVVQRQPFGGCKASSFGFGSKAGGPNYIMQYMKASQQALPKFHTLIEPPAPLSLITAYLRGKISNQRQAEWDASLQSYLFFWRYYFSQPQDPSQILGQDNIFRYKPRQHLCFRSEEKEDLLDLLRAAAAAIICGVSLDISSQLPLPLKLPRIRFIHESIEQFTQRIKGGTFSRVRSFQILPKTTLHVAASLNVYAYEAPILANGRIELLHYLQETSESINIHRYGYLGLSAQRSNPSQCSSCSCGEGACQ